MSEALKLPRSTVADIAIGMYANEPCRICRRLITHDEVRHIVFTGYTDVDGKVSRASHEACWRGLAPEAQEAIKADARAGRVRR